MNEKPAVHLRRILKQACRLEQRIVVLGLGNELRGDDAVGFLIARDLADANNERFTAVPAGIFVENAAGTVRQKQANIAILIDAVVPVEGMAAWDFFPPEGLDTFCHTAHSVPLRLIVQYWRQEDPDLQVYFIGVPVTDNRMFAPVSPAVDAVRREVGAIFRENLPGPAGE